MEMGLDLLALLASQANSPLRQKTPHLLAAKIEFIRKHLLPQLPHEHASKLESILFRIEKLSVQRHDLIHGASIGEERDGEALLITFGRLLQPRSKVRRAPVKVTASQIERATAEVSNLWEDLLDFAEGFAKTRGYKP
jgi:hypothetical protein